jgi:hypothetical protein
MRAARSGIVPRQETAQRLSVLLVSPGNGRDVESAGVRYGNGDTDLP